MTKGEPRTENGTFLRNGLLAMGYDEDSANEAVVAIEEEAAGVSLAAYPPEPKPLDVERPVLAATLLDAVKERVDHDLGYHLVDPVNGNCVGGPEHNDALREAYNAVVEYAALLTTTETP